MVLHHNFLDKIRSNIYIYIYRARQRKSLISALGITLLAAVFCGIVGVGSYKAVAESSAGALLSVTAQDVNLSVAIPENTVSILLNPTSTLETGDLDVVVTTDAPYGYTLMMTAGSSDLTRTTMLDGAYPTIPTLAAGATDFAPNRWGYMLPTDSKFKSFDPTGVQVGYSDSAEVEGKTETITFGAKINSNTPVGDYELGLTLSALVNPKTLLTINDMKTMQAFKGVAIDDKYSILDSMTEGQSYTIKDSRDNQEYTVAKLFDGNIWMTKNLNLAGGTKLYSDTSNVPDGYPSSGNNPYYTLPASSTSGFSNDSTAYVYNSNSTTCGNNSPCYSYYSYPAVTAGTNPDTDGVNATSDICPAGWRLPTKSEYETLLGTYDTAAKLTASPFLGVYGGNYYNSTLYGGAYGNYWSSTASGSTTAYNMYFGSSEAGMYSNGNRNGLSARCILQ